LGQFCPVEENNLPNAARFGSLWRGFDLENKIFFLDVLRNLGEKLFQKTWISLP
jgi:hypothetical protein